MDKETLKTEAPEHKTEDTFFQSQDGRVWLLFGATDDAILAHEVYHQDGRKRFAPLASLPYVMFADWTEATKEDNALDLSGRESKMNKETQQLTEQQTEYAKNQLRLALMECFSTRTLVAVTCNWNNVTAPISTRVGYISSLQLEDGSGYSYNIVLLTPKGTRMDGYLNLSNKHHDVEATN